MIDDLSQVAALSREWGINEEDILFIALNHSGLDSSLDKSRMRMRLRLDSRPEEEFFFILSLGRSDSPFRASTSCTPAAASGCRRSRSTGRRARTS